MHPAGRVAISSDSEYVLLGVRGAANRWKLKGRVGSSGPASNVPIRQQILIELDRDDRETIWIQVPSHLTVEGRVKCHASV